jgi:hypothetical protein
MFILITYGLVFIFGFALGIYALPIMTAPEAPKANILSKLMQQSNYIGSFYADRKDSDFLHNGQGQFSVGPDSISFIGTLTPGPHFKLYLSPRFVETKADFLAYKNNMVKIGDVDTFNNFSVDLPASIDPSEFNTVIIWCESFEQYITSGRYSSRR